MHVLSVGDVVAVHATDSGGPGGFIGEVAWDGNLSVTDASWRVTTAAPGGDGWKLSGFDDSSWVQASSYGSYGVAPWLERVVGFPSGSTAEWIWSADNAGDNEVWLRHTIGG